MTEERETPPWPGTMIKLRPYQQQAIDDLRQGYRDGHRCQILSLATGGGKTAIASEMITAASGKGNSSLFVVDRIELVGQAARHLEAFDLKVGVLQGENTNYADGDENGLDCIVASIQTIRSRGIPPRGFVIIDEVHVLHQAHIDLIEAWDTTPFVGLSATPLTPILAEYFSNLVRGASVAELIEAGYLVRPLTYAPDRNQIQAALSGVEWSRGDYQTASLSAAMRETVLVGNIVKHWEALASDRQTIVFAVDIQHSKDIISRFTEAGHNAAHIDCHTPKEQRRDLIEGFKQGEIQILSSVGVLAVGFDAPVASCAILARPTASLALFIQQAGRVLRSHPDKQDCLILDHASNTHQHGLPESFTVPDLGTYQKPTKRETSATRQDGKTVQCTECQREIAADALACPHCLAETRHSENVRVSEIEAELKLQARDIIEGNSIDWLSEEDRLRWYAGFQWIAAERGYKPGWVWFTHRAAFHKNPPKGRVDPVRPSSEQLRWLKGYFKKKKIEMAEA